MALQRSFLNTISWSLVACCLALSGHAAEKNSADQPVIIKVYPNPANHGDTMYVEGVNFIGPGSVLRAQSNDEDRTPRQGTYVEFTTKYGVNRVPAHLLHNPPVQGAQVCSVAIPKAAVSGPMKIITITQANGRPIGFMSKVVHLEIMDDPAVRQTPAGWSRGAVSLLKAVPKKMLKDAYFYQTERVAREAKDALVRQETQRFLNSQFYDINRFSYFNAVPQLSFGQLTSEPHEGERRRSLDSSSFAARFFGRLDSAQAMPSYTLGNAETMQKDVQEVLYQYTKPLFERLTHLKAESDSLPEKTGFTRPHVRLAYSIGLATSGSVASHGGLARNMGFRVDFDYVRMNPLTGHVRRTMSFSVGADARRAESDLAREQRLLFLIRFR